MEERKSEGSATKTQPEAERTSLPKIQGGKGIFLKKIRGGKGLSPPKNPEARRQLLPVNGRPHQKNEHRRQLLPVGEKSLSRRPRREGCSGEFRGDHLLKESSSSDTLTVLFSKPKNQNLTKAMTKILKFDNYYLHYNLFYISGKEGEKT